MPRPAAVIVSDTESTRNGMLSLTIASARRRRPGCARSAAAASSEIIGVPGARIAAADSTQATIRAATAASM